jgi:hypothetical protein
MATKFSTCLWAHDAKGMAEFDIAKLEEAVK